MVSSYLVHHGYSATAEKFTEITGQTFTEDINSIKTRQSKNLLFNEDIS
jgi:AraC-like DNA-binding protein